MSDRLASVPAEDEPASSQINAFVPVLILGLAMAAWFGFHADQLQTERHAMRALMASQDKQIQDSKKLRDSLEALARGTVQLSDAGNPNARLIVDALKQRGVTFNPGQPPSSDEAGARTK